MRTVDANVLLRFALADHPEQSPRARELLRRVEAGEERIYLPELVISDIVWTLTSFYRWPRDRTRAFLDDLLAQPAVRVSRPARISAALALFVEHNVDYSDALIAAELQASAVAELYSFDRDFDRLPGITRVEP